MKTVVAAILVFACYCSPTIAQKHHFVYRGSTALPHVMINGESAVIHTQGLHVTDRHFVATGRLEKKPKKALLLRFPRDDEKKERVEYIDITPPKTDGETLDHPGGFDVDPDGLFQIPVSTSHRKGPTLILGYRIDPAKPLAEARIESTVKVADHLGAICCKGTLMVGANWDTNTIYFVNDGIITKTVEQKDMLNRGKPHVAVQDWKVAKLGNLSTERVILGGLAKNEVPLAIIQVVDILNDRLYETHRFEMRADISKPITNEGLAVHDGVLYLLPEDIGRGANVLQYRIEAIDAE